MSGDKFIPPFSDGERWLYPENTDLNERIQGDFQKKVLMIGSPMQLSSNQQNLYEKIMQAVKMEVKKDVGTVFISEETCFSLADLVRTMQPTTILLFGVSPLKAGLQIQWQPYQIMRWNNCQLLVTHSLPEIEAEPKYKAHLWQALQVLFL